MLLICVIAVGWVGFTVKRFYDEVADPEVRDRAVRATLGCEALPPGYVAVGNMSVPGLSFVGIADQPPESPTPATRAFTMMSATPNPEASAAIEAFFGGETDDPNALRPAGFTGNVVSPELLDRGDLIAGPQRVSYVTIRGRDRPRRQPSSPHRLLPLDSLHG